MIIFIAGLVTGGLIVFLLARKRLKQHNILNQEIADQNKQLEIENNKLLTIKSSYEENIITLSKSQQNYESVLKKLEEQAQTAADTFYNDKMNLANEKINNAMEKLAERYKIAEQEYENEYLETLKEFSSAYLITTDQQKNEIETAKNILLDLQNKIDVAVEANKRSELERNKKDFYKLVLSEEDIKEIKHLRSVVPYLRNAEALNKVIWKAYYEKPYTDLIGRVIGSAVKTGIYKITNLENGMCYVGQAANIADRWRQHIKRGIGAETPTRNKLYPAMLSFGVENFTFEIIEECDRSVLNDREDYWQEFFKAKEFGYSIK